MLEELKKRFCKDNEGIQKLINTPLVVFTVRGKSISERAKLFLCSIITEKYIDPVIQCFKCLRYGHTMTQCKSSKHCLRCGDTVDNEKKHTDCVVGCIHCKGSHASTETGVAIKYRICPEFLRQKKGNNVLI